MKRTLLIMFALAGVAQADTAATAATAAAVASNAASSAAVAATETAANTAAKATTQAKKTANKTKTTAKKATTAAANTATTLTSEAPTSVVAAVTGGENAEAQAVLTDPTLAGATENTTAAPATDNLLSVNSDLSSAAKDVLTTPAESSFRKSFGVFAAVNVGTQGVGFDLGYEFNSFVKVRFRSAYLSVDYDTTWDGADVSAKFNGNNNGLLVDVHPFGGKFRVTGGLNFAPLSIEAHGEIDTTSIKHYAGKVYRWGAYDYKVNEGNGWVHGKYKWNNVQPYLGIGWSSDGSGERGLYFSFDLGINIMGTGSFTVSNSNNVMQSVSGMNDWKPVNNAMLRNSMMEEGKDFFKIADQIIIYPVLQVGLGFRF